MWKGGRSLCRETPLISVAQSDKHKRGDTAALSACLFCSFCSPPSTPLSIFSPISPPFTLPLTLLPVLQSFCCSLTKSKLHRFGSIHLTAGSCVRSSKPSSKWRGTPSLLSLLRVPHKRLFCSIRQEKGGYCLTSSSTNTTETPFYSFVSCVIPLICL